MTWADAITLGSIFLLLCLSGFFSGSETALTAASRPRIHALAKAGNRRAMIVDDLRAHKDRLIGAILLGNNLVNILASAIATSYLIRLVGDTGVVWATLVMTLLVLIFAEVLPKTYALHNAARMALRVGPLMRWVVMILSPITRAISWIVRGTLRLFGVRDLHLSPDEAEEELRGAIELHAHENAEEEAVQERQMLRSILDLDDITVAEVMTHRRNVSTIDSSLSNREIVDEVLRSPYTRIPLWAEKPENIVGVLHAKALLRAIMDMPPDRIDEIDIRALAKPPWFIPENTNLLDQLQAFRRRRAHFAIVVDEYGDLLGIVTLEDILEEIVGDIDDEHDVIVPGVQHQSDGSVYVDGTVTIRDLNRQLDWNLPDDHAVTIAGLVLHETRQIPTAGQCFAIHGRRFEVIERQRNQITRLRITEIDPAAAAAGAPADPTA